MSLLRLVLLAVAALLAVAGLAACGSSGGKSTATSKAGAATSAAGGATSAAASGGSSASGDTITIKNFTFSPGTLTVKPGTKITVTNNDSVTHTLTAQPKSDFDTGDIASGKTVTFTAPTKPGTYTYICEIHQYMTGKLTVS